MKVRKMKPIDDQLRKTEWQLGDEYGDFPDEQYMLMLQQGDFSVMKILIGRYKQYVLDRFKYISIYDDLAEEMTHEIFIRILESRLTYMPDKSRFKTWLTTIANNLANDHFRRKRKDDLLERELMNNQTEWEEKDESISESEVQQLELAMNRLNHHQLTILYLSKYKAYPYERIAGMLKISVANVKVQVHRSIGQLRKLYFGLDECG